MFISEPILECLSDMETAGVYKVSVSSGEMSNNYIVNYIDGTLTVYNSYSVIFDSDGGSEVSTLKSDKDGLIQKPNNPTKDGYTFLGWYNGNTEFKFTNIITDDITLNAKWEEIKSSLGEEDNKEENNEKEDNEDEEENNAVEPEADEYYIPPTIRSSLSSSNSSSSSLSSSNDSYNDEYNSN